MRDVERKRLAPLEHQNKKHDAVTVVFFLLFSVSQAVILSDRLAGPDRLPVPSLLAVGAVHQHLLTTKQRLKGAIFAEMGDAREVHDMATLIGYV